MVVAILFVAITASGIAWSLRQTDSGLVGTNGVKPLVFVTNLESKSTVCQPFGVPERPAGKLRMTVGTYGKGPQLLEFSIKGHRRVVLESKYQDGVSDFDLPPSGFRARELLCLTNRGLFPVALAGEAAKGRRKDVTRSSFSLSFEIVRSPRTWGSRLGEVQRRLSRGEIDLGRAAPFLAMLAALACFAYSIVALTRTL